MTPLIYHYNPNTHIYEGFTEAIESPLEPGVYLCPAHATFNPPLQDIAESQMNVWDHINNIWSVQNRSPPISLTHSYSIPDPITEDPISKDPEDPIPEPLPSAITQLRWLRNYHLEKVDWVAIKCFTLGIPYPVEWLRYVQALRDLPTTCGELAVDERGYLLEDSVKLPTRPADI